MLMCDGDSGYNYGSGLVAQLQKAGLSQNDIDKVGEKIAKEPSHSTLSFDKTNPHIFIAGYR